MNTQKPKKCPYCGNVWIVEDDQICNRCHKGIEIENNDEPQIYDFVL